MEVYAVDKRCGVKKEFQGLMQKSIAAVSKGKAAMLCATAAAIGAGTQLSFAADYGISNIFNVGTGLVGAIQTGLTSIVGPLAIVSLIYCVARMLTSKDAKVIAEYKKHMIEALAVTVIAFAAPGLINLMMTIGQNVSSGL